MRILVTGALGFIGSHFCMMASEAGHAVIATDGHKYSARVKNLPQAVVPLNICDHQLVIEWLLEATPDIVVNFAAETHVTRSIASHDEFLHTNVIGLSTLLEQCCAYWITKGRPAHFRVVNVSTDEVYGSLNKFEAAWDENSPHRPNNLYAASKSAGDHLARAFFHTHGLPVITTHSSNNYGTRQHPEKLIPTLIARILVDKPMLIHGDGLHVRDWLHVEDNCRGILSAALLGEAGETYNFGGNCERSNLHIAKLVWETVVKLRPHLPYAAPALEFVPDRAGNDRRYGMNCSYAVYQLGWRPMLNLEACIESVVAWYLENPNYGAEYEKE